MSLMRTIIGMLSTVEEVSPAQKREKFLQALRGIHARILGLTETRDEILGWGDSLEEVDACIAKTGFHGKVVYASNATAGKPFVV